MSAAELLSVSAARGAAEVEIVIPVYNEEAAVEASVRRLHEYLCERFPLSWRVTIADNASRDHTWGVVAYMDVDLPTDFDALLPLVAPLLSGHSDVAIGTRLARSARVRRGPKRELISRGYNLILEAALHNRFSDAHCGFKAVGADVARALLPLVEDNEWFFDTELLALAEHNGLRIHEVPVDWVDDADSRVDITDTAREDLRGVWRMLRRFAAGEGTLSEGSLPRRRRRPLRPTG